MIYEIGKFYKVQCVQYRGKWFPVLGKPHTDEELAPGFARHWHYDWRFISDSFYRRNWTVNTLDLEYRSVQVQAWEESHPAKMVRKQCVRVMPTFPCVVQISGKKATLIKKVEALCAGKSIDPANPICPHRGADLADLPIDADGCVVCPMHGAKWSMVTGELVIR